MTNQRVIYFPWKCNPGKFWDFLQAFFLLPFSRILSWISHEFSMSFYDFYDFLMTFPMLSHEFIMAFSWHYHVSLMTFSWFSHDFFMIFSWLSHDYLMTYSLISHEFLLTFLWISHDFLMTFSWLSNDFFMNFSWHSHDFLMTFSWISLDFLVTFLLIPKNGGNVAALWNATFCFLRIPKLSDLTDVIRWHEGMSCSLIFFDPCQCQNVKNNQNFSCCMLMRCWVKYMCFKRRHCLCHLQELSA